MSDTAPQERPRADATAAGRLRVLLAEDNPVNQKVGVRVLESLGCSVEVAATGAEALRLTGTRSYDVLLMDCQMPEMDGYEAAQAIRLREHGSAKRLTIIAMTAHVMEGDREKCMLARMDDYIAKPVKPKTLQEMLSRWFPREDKAA